MCAGTYSFDCGLGETGTKSETTGTVVLLVVGAKNKTQDALFDRRKRFSTWTKDDFL